MSKYNPTIPGRLASRFVKDPSKLVNSVWTRTPTKDEGPFIVTQADRQNVTFLVYNIARVTVVPFQVLLSAIISPVRYALVSRDFSWTTPGNYVTCKGGQQRRKLLYKVVAWVPNGLELFLWTPGPNSGLVHRYVNFKSLRDLKPATEKQRRFASTFEETVQRAINQACLQVLRDFYVREPFGDDGDGEEAYESPQARSTSTSQFEISNGLLKPIVQPEQEKHEDLSEVPTVLDRILATDDSSAPPESAKS